LGLCLPTIDSSVARCFRSRCCPRRPSPRPRRSIPKRRWCGTSSRTRARTRPSTRYQTGAKQRFLASLQWGTHGLAGFATDDLDEHLTHAQIQAALDLFDAGQYAAIIQGRDTIRAPRLAVSDFEQRFDVFYRVYRASPEVDLAQLSLAYKQLIAGPSKPRVLAAGLDTYDLELLYRATLPMVHGDADPSVFEYARFLLDTLAAREDATPARVRALFDRLVTARAFDQADHLVDDFPRSGLAHLPARDFDGAPSTRNNLLQVSADGRQLSRATLSLDGPLRMVVVAGCHFAKDAATAISADPALDRWFHEHATWLAPESESIEEVADWNRQFPRQPIQIAWVRSDWESIASWAMPTFYVFRDDELVAQWSGWAPDSGLRELRRQLGRIGMAPVTDEFLARARSDREWLEAESHEWLATLPTEVRLRVAERALADADQQVQFSGVLQYYAMHLDDRGDAAVAGLILDGFDATGLGWGWIHSGDAGLADRRFAGVRRELIARYDSLSPEQQLRARTVLCADTPDCDPRHPPTP
jgi:hypothetical protein